MTRYTLKIVWISAVGLACLTGCAACPTPRCNGSAAGQGGDPARPRVTPAGKGTPSARSGPAPSPTGEAARAPASAPRTAAPDPVAMFRGDPGRSGRTRHPIPEARPEVIWTHQTGAQVVASPLITAAGRVIVASRDGTLRCLEPGGAQRWRWQSAEPLQATPALVEDDVAVATLDGGLHLLDLDRGQERWRVSLGACSTLPGFGADRLRCQGHASPLYDAASGTIIAASDTLLAVDVAGKVRWRAELAEHPFASPALGPDGTVYIGRTGLRGIVAVGPDGAQRWAHLTKAACDATPALWGDLLVAGCDNGRVYGLDASTGAERWNVRTRGAVRASPALAPDETVIIANDRGRVIALDRQGQRRWTYRAGGRVRSSPALDPAGRILFGAQDNRLYALDPTGAELWTVLLGGEIDASPAVGPAQTLYVGADDGKLYALKPKTDK